MNNSNDKIFEKITNDIIKVMESGRIPWKKPWKTLGNPRNGVTRKEYSGSNAYLGFLMYSSPDFFTFKQINELGGTIKKDEKGHIVVYYKMYTPKDVKKEWENTPESERGKLKQIPLLKYYYVWNRSQVDDLPDPKDIPEPRENVNPIEEAEMVLTGYVDCPPIERVGDKAYYDPLQDMIRVPPAEMFVSDEAFYASLFHECAHSTGAEKRLKRDIKNHFGTADYSKEELVAELSSAFLCSHCGINNTDTETNTAAYLQSWIKVLKNNTKWIFEASKMATKAVDYILGTTKKGEIVTE